MSIGSNLFKRYDNSVDVTLEEVEMLLADLNLIYVQQLHIMVTLRHLEIVEGNANPRPSWDDVGCSFGISDHFNKYRSVGALSQQASWHLMDDCYVPGNAIGIASVAVVCRGGRGINYFSSNSFWLTFAHELGHNFAARHSFELGQGLTGGVMDYGDGRLDGEFQFNTRFRFDDICSYLKNNLETCIERGTAVVGDDASTCGNGVVEPGEECECTSGDFRCRCCENCKLKSGAECDGLNNDCCNDDCTYSTAAETCSTSRGGGYCRAGICQNHICNVCGVENDDPCHATCISGGVCRNVSNWFSLLRDGALCETEELENGVCVTGNCVQRIGGASGLPPEQPSPEQPLLPMFLFVGFAAIFAVVVTLYTKWARYKRNQRWSPHEDEARGSDGQVANVSVAGGQLDRNEEHRHHLQADL